MRPAGMAWHRGPMDGSILGMWEEATLRGCLFLLHHFEETFEIVLDVPFLKG